MGKQTKKRDAVGYKYFNIFILSLFTKHTNFGYKLQFQE